MPTVDRINVEDLFVNTENYRFAPQESQRQAIDEMVKDQGDKLLNLAKHITEHGFNPSDMIMVSPDEVNPTRFIVLEGNRRIIALKILNSPDILDDKEFGFLRKRFAKTASGIENKDIFNVLCIIFDDPNEANTWIKLKHAGQADGIGPVRWNAQQIQRFEQKVEGKSSISLQAIELLSKSDKTEHELKKRLKEVPISSLDRLLSDPTVREFLGLEVIQGVLSGVLSEDEVLKGLQRIALDLLDPKFKVRKIYTHEDRKNYLKNFDPKFVPNSGAKVQQAWPFDSVIDSGTAVAKKKPRPATPTKRKKLIPSNCRLRIEVPKVNAIYRELQKLDKEKFCNSVAISFRVFIELSVDSYIDHHNIGGSAPASKSGTNLQQKVTMVANHMEQKGFVNVVVSKGIKAAVKQQHDLLGVDTWHSYLHNPLFSPTPEGLQVTWDNIQAFIEALWENVG